VHLQPGRRQRDVLLLMPVPGVALGGVATLMVVMTGGAAAVAVRRVLMAVGVAVRVRVRRGAAMHMLVRV